MTKSIFTNEGRVINSQAEHGTAVVVGATVFNPSTLFIGTAGSVTVTTAGGETGVVFANMANGSILPVQVTAVTAATASNIVRMY